MASELTVPLRPLQSLRQNLLSELCRGVDLLDSVGLSERWAECGHHLAGIREEWERGRVPSSPRETLGGHPWAGV